jgi:thiaminase/transcriptional activator TenA
MESHYNSEAFRAWRDASGQSWQNYTHHSFVAGLGDGTLPRPAFIHYLVQDYVFLVHYARCWSMAVVKAGDLEEMKLAASVANGLINHEMRLHVEVCGREGIAEETLYNATEALENLAYTRYVMDAGLSGDFLDLMAAVTPCVLGYGEIGLRLDDEAPADGPYREWINTYADPQYQSLCDDVGKLLDHAARARLGNNMTANPRWSALTRRFDMATRLEGGFWDMGLRGEI